MSQPPSIVIHAYNPQWPRDFETARAGLASALGDLALRIDHIGSTSVPGLGAKDVIDIQVSVAALEDSVRQRLVQAGYILHPANADHVPAGEDPDPERWCKFLFTEPPGQRRANIHIRALGKPNQVYPLLFRDYLRAHPGSAQTVERIKRALAQHHPNDIDAYYDIKDPVYDLIWHAAREWAIQTGYQP
jgi:GrpB-like predicted nucleotidyltransferase (UPF0157 family)